MNEGYTASIERLSRGFAPSQVEHALHVRILSVVRNRDEGFRLFIAAILVLALSCGKEPASAHPPDGAQVMENGVRWLRVKSGTGRLGAQAVWWSVSWTDVPCSDECEHVYSGHRSTKIYDPFRSNLLAMREGEVRRLWIPRTDKDGFWTADVQLYQVYATGSDGGPRSPPQPPPRFPVQPYEQARKTTSAQ